MVEDLVGILPARGYQLQGRDHLRANDRAALFLDMSMGKTRIVLDALTARHLPVLVVAPKRVAEGVWHEEAAKWRPDLSVVRAVGAPAQRAQALAYGADVTVISVHNMADAIGGPWRTVVLDELSMFKSRGAWWKTARRVLAPARYRWGLTGTPSPNGYIDLWPQISLLDDGERLGRNITAYRTRYFRPGRQLANGTITSWLPREHTEERINELLADLCLSMSEEGRLELPPVSYNDVVVDLPPKIRAAYKAMKDKMLARMEDGSVFTATDAGAKSSRLSQLAAGFLFEDESDAERHTWLHDEKLDAVAEVVNGTGSPVLALYRFRPEREQLLRLPGARGMDDPDIIAAWNAGDVPLLVAHPQSIGHGLNLQYGGHTAVWASLPWSLEHWLQTNKRLPRPGQEHPVVIHRVMARDTLDYDIKDVLEGKKSVQDGLRSALEAPL